ncbi:hypothetical protein DB31_2553 [Hyalangium minutum]|uniref:Uncharacterized protein n=1 Tax=Hyalangium minutum TaxID=394096 RepID=A0A085W6X2_9BACT|nr:hypothetical protein DB31_2553 [Hyalangium minutum]
MSLASRGWGLRGTPPAPPSSLRLTEDRHRAGRGLFFRAFSSLHSRGLPAPALRTRSVPISGRLGGATGDIGAAGAPGGARERNPSQKVTWTQRPADAGRHTTVQKHVEFFTPLTAL